MRIWSRNVRPITSTEPVGDFIENHKTDRQKDSRNVEAERSVIHPLRSINVQKFQGDPFLDYEGIYFVGLN